MAILENMTLGEKLCYERMKKTGYTDEQIKKSILGARAIPQEEKEKTNRLIVKNMVVGKIPGEKKER